MIGSLICYLEEFIILCREKNITPPGTRQIVLDEEDLATVMIIGNNYLFSGSFIEPKKSKTQTVNTAWLTEATDHRGRVDSLYRPSETSNSLLLGDEYFRGGSSTHSSGWSVYRNDGRELWGELSVTASEIGEGKLFEITDELFLIENLARAILEGIDEVINHLRRNDYHVEPFYVSTDEDVKKKSKSVGKEQLKTVPVPDTWEGITEKRCSQPPLHPENNGSENTCKENEKDTPAPSKKPSRLAFL